jgi:hypothetical protein
MTNIKETIDIVAGSLPDLPQPLKKNIFDIMGVQNKETINSKVLAYFLDPNEDHGFGTLFFDSFLQVAMGKQDVKWDSIELGKFKVFREEITSQAEEDRQKGKRIDIIIKGENWCIIIENKLYHDLQNPLKAYWQHAKKNNSYVLGIVLSLHEKSVSECSDGDIRFTNITHLEWIAQIQTNLILGDHNSDTDIFYLREYIKTIKDHYKRKMDEPILNNIIKKLTEQRAEIQIIEKAKSDAVTFIETTIAVIFKLKGYKKENQLYRHKDYNGLCFYVIPGKTILEENGIRFGFEVHEDVINNVGMEVLEKISSELERKFEKIGELHFDKFKLSKSSIRLITYRKSEFIENDVNIKTGLEGILDTYFFNKGGIHQTVLSMLTCDVNCKSTIEE